MGSSSCLAVGWSRTTLTDVARRAGVSRMTLYRRWSDMRAILADLMTREWAETAAATGFLTGFLTGALTGRDEGHEAVDALDRISRGVVETVRALRENVLLRRIIDVDPQELLPYLLDRRGRSQEMVGRALAEAIGRGQRDGSVRRGDPTRMARALLLTCHGFTLSAHTMVPEEHAVEDAGGDAGEDWPPDRTQALRDLDDELGRLVNGFLRP